MHKISPTNISLWKECQRKWSFRYRDHIETDPGPGAEFGTLVHSYLEKYLRGEPPDSITERAAEVAACSIEHLPPPNSPGAVIERLFEFTFDGVTYLGKKDLETPDWVVDHKTTKDFKWAKTPEDLQTDVQAIVYAADTLIQNPDKQCVDMKWNYMRTKGTPMCKPVVVRLYKDNVEREFQKIHALTKEKILPLYDDPRTTLELPASPEACESFGGCPYRHICNLSPLQRMQSIMSTGTNDLIEKLRARQTNGVTPGTSTKPMLPPPMPEAPPAHVPPPALVPTAVANAVNPPEYQPPPPPPEPVEATAPKVKRGRKPTEEKHDTTPSPAPDSDMYGEYRIGALFIDCVPNNLPPTGVRIEDLYASANRVVKSEFKVDDFRLLDYGKGPGAFSVAMSSVLDKSDRVPALVVDSHSPEAQACLSALIARSRMVVRGRP